MPVYIAEERKYESKKLVEVADESVETNFAQAGRKPCDTFGRGRPIFQRGRVFRGRGERHIRPRPDVKVAEVSEVIREFREQEKVSVLE